MESKLVEVAGGRMQIVPAQREDLPDVFTLFEESQTWLVAQGIVGQWGTTPFSALPHSEARFGAWIDAGSMFLGYLDGELAGVITVSRAPPEYCRDACTGYPAGARYIEAFSTARKFKGRGIGAALLRWAEETAREAGAPSVWLDCYADNPRLVEYYRQARYRPRDDFYVGSWRGQVFDKELY